MARPEEIGSLAWQTSRPSRFERQLVSSISAACGSIVVEKVAARGEEVELVGGDQRAERQRVGLQEGDRLAVAGRIGVQREVDAADHASPRPRWRAQAGKTRMIELCAVVTPMK